MNFNILGNTLLNTLIRKGTRGFSTKELNTSDLKELVELAKLSENKDIKLNNLLKLCKDPDLLKLVYNKIKSNLSNMIEDEYIDKFNCGTVRKIDLKYSKLSQLIRRAKLFSERIKLSKLRAKTTNLHLKNDLDFKRLKYVRYGDDILLGVIGSKQDCIIIQDSLSKFIETLNLNINKDKTFIKCASKKLARFLGYDIKITLRHKYLIVNKHYSIRTIRGLNNTRLIINALIRYILNNLVDHGYARSCKNGRFAQLTGLGRLMHEEIHVIINHYLMVGRGILSYYRLATNYNKLKHRI
ncbi:Putative COX1/OXI3 intron 1 protein [Wickerhamiella sorbophila]|uniref:COX1/OXI3 intron 1 protein n=1 Tax=Wickerhamiella sorbophila TaxID=45607 RepID=A0A2T0FGQ7_9ASCO|nr:Putative COX1/OXI3 intron 1 protein [Wickerhamiella sorbophila]XP_024664143.1 Putative COX1/OXI3 intron 1 protein [Wickerhamiella sorbophila]XP_024664157.1 Putative COX1/OXI3 intron 1 protein [Wickerhamiella sorbophila]PRT54178.1 Putative COX1/OXI3 intron 1 protein [Wickerhamiella sorbophila]PRT54198.1 Putative COX1/OXI3 intron 1 protein [Wickerhamiella sorbophila]PRT54212.1 Putative COX1/OXI3 intron 1 protein [Wickerhamiella sorbophila]